MPLFLELEVVILKYEDALFFNSVDPLTSYNITYITIVRSGDKIKSNYVNCNTTDGGMLYLSNFS